MINWRHTKLGNLVKFKAGTGFPKHLQGERHGSLPFAKVSDMNRAGNEVTLSFAENHITEQQARDLRAYVHQPGSVAFAKIGVALTSNRRRQITRPIVLDNNMMSAEPIGEYVDETYNYYLLSTLDFNEISAGSALPYLTVGSLKDIDVTIPTLKEQVRIAATLGALDDKIELNRKMAATLEEMARALYRSWFVDFDPVHARSQGLPPARMDQTTAALFPDSFGDDGLPEGWELGTIGDLAKITSGKRPPVKVTKADDENNVPVYGGNGIAWFTNETLFTDRLLVTGRVGTLGTVFRIYNPCWVSDNALCLFPHDANCYEYLYFVTAEVDFQSLNSGSTQPLLTQTNLKSQPAIKAPSDVLREFHLLASKLFEQRQNLELQNQTLATLRDTLLPRLMSGELRVGEAREQVEEVV